MKRVELNKENKRASLLKTSFELFQKKGFTKTSISDIVKEAGMAKGTFYLYFKDKYDLRNQLITKKSQQVIAKADRFVQENPVEGFEEQLLAFVDYILNYLQKDRILFQFISKNLNWGLFENMLNESVEDQPGFLMDRCLRSMEKEKIQCRDLKLMLFTIMEMVNGTAHSCVLEGRPVPMEEYLPYLHESICAIIHVYCSPAVG